MHGSYSLSSSTKKSFTLQVTQREFGSALFADSQHLLNHATEHRAHLLSHIADDRSASPSWTFVTLYYFALFIALAWTRASNGSILYLDKKAIEKYCGMATVKPAGGAYSARLYIDPSTQIPFVEFKKCSSSHFHEAVWIAVNKSVNDIFQEINQQSQARKLDAEEILALRALGIFSGYSFKEPLVWPSKLRNGVNYRPGFSYRSVLKNNSLKLPSKLRRNGFSSLTELVEHGERMKAKLSGVGSPTDMPNECIDLLVAQSLLLEKYTEETFRVLCDKNELKQSSFRQRKIYAGANCSEASMISPLMEA
jgi:hypothetical protein